MDHDPFVAMRERLEEQLRADIELLHQAHRAKLRAFETVARVHGDLAQTPGYPGAGQALPVLGLPAAPAPQATASVETRRPKKEGWADLNAIADAMERLPEVFDKNDVVRVLGYAPKRATLYRALDELRNDGLIVKESESEGRQPGRFRKLAGPKPEDA
jgi:hypothetical protein